MSYLYITLQLELSSRVPPILNKHELLKETNEGELQGLFALAIFILLQDLVSNISHWLVITPSVVNPPTTKIFGPTVAML